MWEYFDSYVTLPFMRSTNPPPVFLHLRRPELGLYTLAKKIEHHDEPELVTETGAAPFFFDCILFSAE